MSGMVDRVAEAIWRADEVGAVGPYDELARGDRENYRCMAQAAIDAMQLTKESVPLIPPRPGTWSRLVTPWVSEDQS